MTNPHGDLEAGAPRHETNKYYMMVKRHFQMDVSLKQYKLMCVALLDTLKFCFDKEYSADLKISWERLFTSLLKGLLKYAVAFEIVHLPGSGQNSYSSSSYFAGDAEPSKMQSVGPDDMRILDSYSMLADDDVHEEGGSFSSLDSKQAPSSNGSLNLITTSGNTTTVSTTSSNSNNALLVDDDKQKEFDASCAALVDHTKGLNE